MNATMQLEEKRHYPVMLDQILSIISPQHGGTFIDCTFGGGGYSSAILKHPEAKVFVKGQERKGFNESVSRLILKIYRYFYYKFHFGHCKYILYI